ncbi:MAG: hypothetical protein Alis3KO_27010 [Aliiglaciecola sp.]|uniref:BLUF domain-containing protein n=1 Tax=Aliiglaciecola sp. M165 TaxID=2593649 RepID=UPI00117F4C97|nr:BLUF domain-containing protein [Aliiglaciecola sp. M165]TRY30664.1 BLUF domain-containing protein [Aliiglaciecola sp. M165]
MIEIIYVSRASQRFKDNELSNMLKVFRKNNQSKNISGLLLYNGSGTFIQALEGDEHVVSSLYETIRRDPRHSRVNLLGKEEISERKFPDWRMGFQNISKLSLAEQEGFSDFMLHAKPLDFLTAEPSFAVDMLEYFKQSTNLDLDKD